MKKFHTLKEIETNNLSKLKYRALKSRLKAKLLNNEITFGKHLFKIGNCYQIHFSLLQHFQKNSLYANNKNMQTAPLK